MPSGNKGSNNSSLFTIDAALFSNSWLDKTFKTMIEIPKELFNGVEKRKFPERFENMPKAFSTQSERFPSKKDNGITFYQRDAGETTLIKKDCSKAAATFGSTTNRKLNGVYLGVPGPTAYDLPSGINLMLENKSCKFGVASKNARMLPGRHVANDYKFSLTKSERLRERKRQNQHQLDEVMKGDKDVDGLFADQKSVRRMQHFSLYF